MPSKRKYKTWLLLLGICICCTTHAGAQRKIYLLSVGIADYPGEKHDLSLPANDAKTIQWLYQKNKHAETVLLTDGQATRANILGHITRLYAQAGADDIVVFFFSGHGYPGGFVGYDTSISYQDIRKAMVACAAKNKMIFADACFSGDMRGRKQNTQSSSAQVMLFLSSRDNEYSIESPSITNGFFTTCLQQGLRGNADTDKNRIITARELFNFVSKGVKKLSNDRQHPVMWGKFDDSMPVMVW